MSGFKGGLWYYKAYQKLGGKRLSWYCNTGRIYRKDGVRLPVGAALLHTQERLQSIRKV